MTQDVIWAGCVRLVSVQTESHCQFRPFPPHGNFHGLLTTFFHPILSLLPPSSPSASVTSNALPSPTLNEVISAVIHAYYIVEEQREAYKECVEGQSTFCDSDILTFGASAEADSIAALSSTAAKLEVRFNSDTVCFCWCRDRHRGEKGARRRRSTSRHMRHACRYSIDHALDVPREPTVWQYRVLWKSSGAGASRSISCKSIHSCVSGAGRPGNIRNHSCDHREQLSRHERKDPCFVAPYTHGKRFSFRL